MIRPSAHTVRDSHQVLSRVMSGEVTPRCQRAQRAAAVASRYPLSMVETMESQERRSPARCRVDDRGRQADRDALLGVVFGDVAPHAKKVFHFLGTSNGQRVLGVGAIAATVLIITGK